MEETFGIKLISLKNKSRLNLTTSEILIKNLDQLIRQEIKKIRLLEENLKNLNKKKKDTMMNQKYLINVKMNQQQK